MPKVVLYIATSLDGYIASSDGTVDWLFHDADYGYMEFMESVDAVVVGRKTWEQAKSFEDVPFADKQVVVFSHSLSNSSESRIRFVQGSPYKAVTEIRSRIEKDIWLVGGGELIQQFIASDLIDEFRLFIHPIILGRGIPLFAHQTERKKLSFVRGQSFPSGLMELTYRYHQPQHEHAKKEISA